MGNAGSHIYFSEYPFALILPFTFFKSISTESPN